MYKTYILIDTVLAGELDPKPWATRGRDLGWIAPIYGRHAIDVSPVIVDIEQANQASKMATVMGMVNANRPQLGISFIDTELTLHKIVKHFRKFIYVRTDDDTELTLRFADCAVLPSLASIFTPLQWTALTSPFKRWQIHDRDNNLISLPISVGCDTPSLPLLLNNTQIDDLKNSMAADQLLFNLNIQRPAPAGVYKTARAHEYAQSCLRLWHAANHPDNVDLMHFASSVFDTKGKLLRAPELTLALAQSDYGKINASLRKIIASL